MTVLTGVAADADQLGATRESASSRAWGTAELPAWPVLVLLAGYPLWWVVGLLPFAQVIMAVPMLAFLIKRQNILLVPGVLPWFAFVFWMIPAGLMVEQNGQAIGLAIRFSQYLAMAIMMVYIVNARASLSPKKLLNSLVVIWVFVIVGGYLGMAFPQGRLTWTIGRLLPGFLADNDYISGLVFPPLAEIQTPWGAAEPFMRPSAPFTYTNGWGAAMAILTPVVVATVVAYRRPLAWGMLLGGLLLAVPPAIATTNRGLFLGLGLAFAYVLVRLLLSGNWLAFVQFGVLAGVGAVALAAGGVLEGIAERQETVDTTEGRSLLYRETFQRTLESPILGYGAPRPSTWSEIYVGTQGAIWNVMFCFGFVGLALFAYAMLSGAFRTLDAPNLSVLWLHSSVVIACVLAFFYGMDRHLVFIAAVLALLFREKYLSGSRYWTATPESFSKRSREVPRAES